MLRLGDNLALPVEAVTTAFGILGQRGSGKTSTAVVLVEEMVKAGTQVAIVDPLDAWFGVRSSSDGNGPGLPVVVFGGDHGDLPLDVGMAATLADVAVDEQVPMVLSLRHLSKADQRRFVAAWAERLYHRKGAAAHRQPLHVVIDEADAFCLTPDTEVLTEHGWRVYDQIGESRVSCFDPETGTYCYEHPTRLVTRHYDGEMVRLQTKSLDLLATPDHRVLIQRYQRAPGRYGHAGYSWTFVSADKVPQQVRLPIGGAACGAGIADYSDEEFRIAGWVLTDGGYHNRSESKTLCIEQSEATTKLGLSIHDEMTRVLSAYEGVSVYDRVRDRGQKIRRWFLGKSLSTRLAPLIGEMALCVERRIPRQLLEQGSKAQLRALFQGLMEGDGTSRNGDWSAFYPGRSKGFADDMQELACKLGMNTTASLVHQKAWPFPQWHVRVASQRRYHELRRPKSDSYSGLVWDITVPTGAFVIRRNGRVSVTGNCPQAVRGDVARVMGAVDDLVRRGRSSGFGITLITQRAAAINKDVLSQIDTLVALRTVSPQDRKALEAWIEAHDTAGRRGEFLASLSSLEVGEAWVWSPGWLDLFERVRIRPRETFDSSATPKVGERAVTPTAFAPVDLERLRGRLEQAVERAAADDPKVLRQRIAELERQAKAAPAIPDPIVERVEVPVLTDEDWRRLDEVYGRFESAARAVIDLGRELRDTIGRVKQRGNPATARPAHLIPVARRNTPAAASPVRPTRRLTVVADGPNLRAGERKMLAALARHPARLTKQQLATLSRFSVKGGTFGTYLGTIKRAGLVAEEDGHLMLTEAGRALLRDEAKAPPATTDEILAIWRPELRAGERAMLDELVRVYPGALSRQELAERAGFTVSGGTFSTYLGVLRRNGLIDVNGGDVTASPTLFLGER